jgi:PleD family two-component response regulator
VDDVDVRADAEAAIHLLWLATGSEATTMMHADTVPQRARRQAVRTMMIVGREPDERAVETVTEAGGYDIIAVERTSTAYSRIKRFMPTVVVLMMGFDDLEACQLMAMLKLDRDTSHIPVLTCLLLPPQPPPHV